MEDHGQFEPESEEAPSTITYGAVALLLQYSQLRSSFIVAEALAKAFPTQEAWLAAVAEPELHEALSSFSELLEELKQAAVAEVPTIDALSRLGAQHYGRALECVEAFALRIGVSPMDLLVVSM